MYERCVPNYNASFDASLMHLDTWERMLLYRRFGSRVKHV
ncbi:hypothetical protein GMOD_00005135 [Pyrenophora seminiperda CCB06]|uniref:Uncharacterized protein n=1 Tax=Pyrenophora seminiperda CCB06 TaxID=1302712 RepID=A0A3M7LV07_9PLEO|nr:hypothetical protein GMOD_00005135 [Pyrenophora seminiperda CCB06]